MKLNHTRYLITAFTTSLRLREPFDEVSDFDYRFRGILRRHLAILAWWSLLSIVLSVVALACMQGLVYYFFMMNMVWGVINLCISMLVFDHAVLSRFQKGNAFERFEAQRHVEKILLLNIGLDFAYCFMGLLLREHGLLTGISHPELWLGFGWAVILQGVFLFSQDVWVYRLHAVNFEKAAPFLKKAITED